MPRFFPEHIEELFYPRRSRFKDRSSAERQTYESLKKNLHGDYDVYYSVRWLHKGPRSGGQDGEADFVLVHPDLGFLILEVKGGGISRRNGRWFSTDARGRRHAIKDPYEQAMSSKWALLKKLKSMPMLKDQWLDAGHAVIFPDCERPAHSLGSDAIPQISLFANDLKRLGTSIDRIFAYWQEHQDKQQNQSNGPLLKQAIRQLLAPDFELSASLRKRLAGEEKEFLKLSKDQYRVLDYLIRTPRVLISGQAGTGKTTLAIEKARRLAQEGYATLWVCLHPGLADEVHTALRKVKNLKVISLPALMQLLAGTLDQIKHNQARAHPDIADLIKSLEQLPLQNSAVFFNQDASQIQQNLGQCLQILQHALPTFKDELRRELMHEDLVEALVIDEGHLLGTGFWQSLALLLEEPDRDIVYIFYDPALFLFSDAGNPEQALPDLVPIPLQANLRNTRNIARMASIFQTGQQPPTDGPEGQPIEFHSLPDQHQAPARRSALEQIVQSLVQAHKIRPEEIALLTPLPLSGSCLQSVEKLAGVRLANERNAVGATILYDNLLAYSGLERPVVVLLEMDPLLRDFIARPDSEHAALLYFAITRARSHLIWLGQERHIEWLQKQWLQVLQG